jgi:hypothetical protein
VLTIAKNAGSFVATDLALTYDEAPTCVTSDIAFTVI